MSTEIELVRRGGSKGDTVEDVPDPVEESGGAGAVIMLILLSPFLLVLFILLFVLWLFLLPFRTCTHRHSGDAKIRPKSDATKVGDKVGDYFQSAKTGCWLFYKRWVPQSGAGIRGVVFVAHGFGEHISRAGYTALAKHLNDAGYAMCALDHQGHGQSTGDRAFHVSINDLVDDYLQFIRMHDAGAEAGAVTFEKNVPRIIFGHIMGGLIAMSASVQADSAEYKKSFPTASPIALTCLSSPCFGIDPKLATPALKTAAKVLSNLLPKLVLKGLPPSYLSRNPAAVKDYENDPLNWHGGARARVGAEMLREMSAVLAKLPQFHGPLLLQHGKGDLVVPVSASKAVWKAAGSEDKTFLRYEGLYHEAFEDQELAETWFGDLVSWLNNHTAPSAAGASSAPQKGQSHVIVPSDKDESAAAVVFHTEEE